MDFAELIYEKKFHIELEGGVARIAVNRPKSMNAFTLHTMDEAFRAMYDASHDPMIGVILFTGAGDHFGTGGDVEWEQWGLREQFYWRHAPNRLLRISRKPVIAVVKGYCVGGSNHLAYCCDLTIAADTAIFAQNGPRVSSPADGYIMPYLVRVVGAKKAREMWMLCRRYSASEALEMGLVNKVVPLNLLDEEVDKWCEEIMVLSPGCIEVLKASFDWELDTMPQLGLTSGQLYPDWFDMPEGQEGVQAFLNKRKPEFWKIRKSEIESRKKETGK
ncbi:MAG: enoyl-CoA hydratase/isomerase family protein [Candidatus Tectomicrobia bacterium]|uniref:Enoyl-CoA hydratase/isomerase family protein n=1 Tax=Tectimicrobiota bacterium TaxID=2528274 RepID=A0A933LPA6_UNCTE|nr:enoyl-CoA hydratase/isomerase family protein [Candidatus Tectomicrobia bacterium]